MNIPSRASLPCVIGSLLAVSLCAGCRMPQLSELLPRAGSDSVRVVSPTPRSAPAARAVPAPTPSAAPSAVQPPRANTPWLALSPLDWLTGIAFAGWFTSLALVMVILRQNQQWRTSFRTREWYLVPSDHGDVLLSAVQRIIEALQQNSGVVQHSLRSVADATSLHTDAVERTRSEFGILRDELEDKRAALEAARLGAEFRTRRPALLALARAVDMIREDHERGRDAASTLQGLQVELGDCLQDHGIVTRSPVVGQPFAHDPAIDLGSVVREAAPSESVRGTISAVERPAYVVRAADGQEEVLLPARVRIHV